MKFEYNNELYTYHIKDEYFEVIRDIKNSKVMSNKENGGYRPNYYAVKEVGTDIMWMIPLSSQIDKYEKEYNKKMKKHGKCLNMVISEYGGKRSVFLLQNMFPILPKYIDHVHTANGKPLKVHKNIKIEIDKKFKQIMQMKKRKIIIPFTKIDELYAKMLEELEKDKK
ncbi:hypothetical protein [Clostridium sp. D43t1_170807_H7]|uniref:type III toxin-antitoxin system CptIN family toxin n=1 Tax=Clostridium sp. D43t1_170807_H7 TaxID=2787140 RepID=UPI00189C2BC4|nr:hypothetical protein [Clostridium sp. D43t1_170807_H7]